MITTDSKNFQSDKKSIQSTLQIRTNKHRCFVFCIGHSSLTCVPGIGKKNKYLLNQSGIQNLSRLYSKYRSINNIQNFKQWLQNDIGFTSYQAKMTACGIGTKLGEIKETHTGLIPIYCRSNERRKEKYKLFFNNRKRNRSNQSVTQENKEETIKKQKNDNIKLENISPDVNQDKSDKYIPIKDDPTSDNYLTGVKHPDNPIFAIRSPLMKDNNESDSSSTSSSTKLSFDKKYGVKELSETKSKIDQTTHEHIDPLKSTKKNSISNTHLNKSLSSISEQSNISQISNNIHETNESKVFKPESYFNQQEKVSQSNKDNRFKKQMQPKKSSITNDSKVQQVDSILSSESFIENKQKSESLANTNGILPYLNSSQDTTMNNQPVLFPQASVDGIKQDSNQKKPTDNQLKSKEPIDKETHQSPPLLESKIDIEQRSLSKEKKSTLHSNVNDLPTDKRIITEVNPRVNEISTLNKQKLQSTLNVSEDKNDEFLSASQKLLDDSISNMHSKSILHSTQSKPASATDADLLYGAIKEQQRQIKNKPFQTKSSLSNDRMRPDVNKLEEKSLSEIDNKSISSTTKSHTSLHGSTPDGPPIKSNSTKKSDSSNLSQTMSKNHLTRIDPEENKTNTTSPINHIRTSVPIVENKQKSSDKITSKSINNTNTHQDKDTSISISKNKEQESIPNQFDTSSFNETQQENFQKEISKAISQIMKEAAQIFHNDTQPSSINVIPSTTISPTESSSIQTTIKSNKNERSSQSSEQLSNKTSSTNQRTQSDNEKLQFTQSHPYKMSENGWIPMKETPDDHESHKDNQSSKSSITTDKQTNHPHQQLKKPILAAKWPTSINMSPSMIVPEHNRKPDYDSSSSPASHKIDPLTNSENKQQISSLNKSSELLKGKLPNEKKSLSTLSSLSNSDQSLNRTTLSIDKIQYNITDDLKKDESDVSTMPIDHTHPLINKNLSKTINSKENIKLKEEIFDNDKLRINSNITDSKYLSVSSPSCPMPCYTFWNNISNEKLLCQRKHRHFKLIRKKSM